MIDDEDLSDWIRHRNSDPDLAMPTDETIWLPEDAKDARERLDRLQGRLTPDYEDGRTALLSCPICGDSGCGALTAELIVTDDAVEWRDLGWTSADDSVVFFGPALTLTFDRAQYHQVLGDARDRLGNDDTSAA